MPVECILPLLKPNQARTMKSTCLTDGQIVDLFKFTEGLSLSNDNELGHSLKVMFSALPFESENMDIRRWLLHDPLDSATKSYQLYDKLAADNYGARLLSDIQMNLVPYRSNKDRLSPGEVMDLMARINYHQPNTYELLGFVQNYAKAHEILIPKIKRRVLEAVARYLVVFLSQGGTWLMMIIDRTDKNLMVAYTGKNRPLLRKPENAPSFFIEQVRKVMLNMFGSATLSMYQIKGTDHSLVSQVKYLMYTLNKKDVFKLDTFRFLNTITKYKRRVRPKQNNLKEFERVPDPIIRASLYYLLRFLQRASEPQVSQLISDLKGKARDTKQAGRLVPYIYDRMMDVTKALGWSQTGWVWIEMIKHVRDDPWAENLGNSRSTLLTYFQTYFRLIPARGKVVVEHFAELYPKKSKDSEAWFKKLASVNMVAAVQVVRELYRAAVMEKPMLATQNSPLTDPRFRYNSWLIRPIGPVEIQSVQKLFGACNTLIGKVDTLIREVMTSNEVALDVDTKPVTMSRPVPKTQGPPVCKPNIALLNRIKSLRTMKNAGEVSKYFSQLIALRDSGRLLAFGSKAAPFVFPVVMDKLRQANRVAIPSAYVSAPAIPSGLLYSQFLNNPKNFGAYAYAVTLFTRIVSIMSRSEMWTKAIFMYPCADDLVAVSISLRTALQLSYDQKNDKVNAIVQKLIFNLAKAVSANASKFDLRNSAASVFVDMLSNEGELQKYVLLSNENPTATVASMEKLANGDIARRLGLVTKISSFA